MIFTYLRVSSNKQDFDNQRNEIDKYLSSHRDLVANTQHWADTVEPIIQCTDYAVSGTVDYTKRSLYEVMKIIRENDTLIISELSRLGRELFMIMEILRKLMQKKIHLISLKENFEFKDDLTSKVLSFAFSLVADLERELISKRTKSALEEKRKLGILIGRPFRDDYVPNIPDHFRDDLEKIKIAHEFGVSYRELARRYKINRSTLRRWLSFLEGNDVQFKRYDSKKETKNVHILDNYHEQITELIKQELSIPEICNEINCLNYNDLYDYISLSKDLNELYRRHGQIRLLELYKAR